MVKLSPFEWLGNINDYMDDFSPGLNSTSIKSRKVLSVFKIALDRNILEIP